MEFYGFRVSRLWGFTVLGFLDFKDLMSYGFRVSGFRVLRFEGFNVLGF